MADTLSLSAAEWTDIVSGMGEKSFLGPVIFEWIHARHVVDYSNMTNVPKALREKLSAQYPLVYPDIVRRQTSADGTAKYLLSLEDGKEVECVLMHYSFGYSLCVSTQAGCRMGCRFCASTLEGLERSLTAGEMCGQVYRVEQESGHRISHIVLMGCGEPFDNYEAVLSFLKLLHDARGKNLSFRNLTVSTCGLPGRIREFALSGLPVTLAVSLHAPNDEIRRQIMRIAEAVPMEELMAACDDYTAQTNHRITYEYLLIRGLNDSPACARELSSLLSSRLSHVNLIPVNPVRECGFERPLPQTVRTFQNILEEHHVPVSVRREMGTEIDAACGQLRARNRQNKEA